MVTGNVTDVMLSVVLCAYILLLIPCVRFYYTTTIGDGAFRS